jgi:hypothetical protein
MEIGDEDEDFEPDGHTSPRPSQARLDALEEDEADEVEDVEPRVPPAERLFESSTSVGDDDARRELAEESLVERAARYRRFLSTERWQQIRVAVFARDGGRCRRCDSEATQVHHELYQEPFEDPDLDDLVSFCASCHRTRHLEMRSRESWDPVRMAHDIADILANGQCSGDD